jgi:hypothetical protein
MKKTRRQDARGPDERAQEPDAQGEHLGGEQEDDDHEQRSEDDAREADRDLVRDEEGIAEGPVPGLGPEGGDRTHRLHQHRVLEVNGERSGPVRANGEDLVNLVFAEPDLADPGETHPKSDYDDCKENPELIAFKPMHRIERPRTAPQHT